MAIFGLVWSWIATLDADAYTIAFGGIVVAGKTIVRKRTGRQPWITTYACVMDFLNGCSFVPFLLLVVAVFYIPMFTYVAHSDKVFMGIAGFMGMIFVAGEIAALRLAGEPHDDHSRNAAPQPRHDPTGV